MDSTEIKTVFIATLICLVTIPLIALVQTIMDLTINIHLAAPLSSYILSGFLPPIAGGFYIATQKIKAKYLVCLLTAISYSILQQLDRHITFLAYIGEKEFSTLDLINLSILSFVLLVGTYSLFSHFLNKKSV